MTRAHRAINVTFNVEGAKMSAQFAAMSNLVVSRSPFKFARVVDGDTIAGKIKTQMELYFPTIGMISVDVWLPDVIRLRHIDVPEKKTFEGKAAITFVVDWLSEHTGSLELEYDGTREKYGRLLGVVYAGKITLQQALLDAHLAVPYEGGKR